MKEIHLAKADPLGAPCESVTIIIDQSIPKLLLDSAERPDVSIGDFYEQQAKTIHGALRQSIPSGTMHRLLIELLKHTENLYRGVK